MNYYDLDTYTRRKIEEALDALSRAYSYNHGSKHTPLTDKLGQILDDLEEMLEEDEDE